MKIKKIIAVAAASMLVFGVHANDDGDEPGHTDGPKVTKTQDVDVKVNIKKACYLKGTDMVNFGDVTPDHRKSGKIDAWGAVKFKCTKGTPYELKFGGGNDFNGSRHLTNMAYDKDADADGSMASMNQLAYWLLKKGTNKELGKGIGTESYGVIDTGNGKGLAADKLITYKFDARIYYQQLNSIIPGWYTDKVTVSLCF